MTSGNARRLLSRSPAQIRDLLLSMTDDEIRDLMLYFRLGLLCFLNELGLAAERSQAAASGQDAFNAIRSGSAIPDEAGADVAITTRPDAAASVRSSAAAPGSRPGR